MFDLDLKPALRAAGAFAPYECFAPGKTSAQGQFTCPEHMKSIWDPIESLGLSMGLLGNVAQYLGMDAFFNLK